MITHNLPPTGNNFWYVYLQHLSVHKNILWDTLKLILKLYLILMCVKWLKLNFGQEFFLLNLMYTNFTWNVRGE